MKVVSTASAALVCTVVSVHIVKQPHCLRFPLPLNHRCAPFVVHLWWFVRNSKEWLSLYRKTCHCCVVRFLYISQLHAANFTSSAAPTALKHSCKTIIASREHQRHPGVWRPLLCSAPAVQGLTMGALWVNACQTFTFSKNTHPHKKRGG